LRFGNLEDDQLPVDTATPEDVRAIYELAYELKCKGVTVYRDGSRDNQVLSNRGDRQSESRACRCGDGSQMTARGEVGDLKGTIAELDGGDRAAEEAAVRCRSRESSAPAEARASGRSAWHFDSQGNSARHDVRAHHRDDRGQPFEVFINLGKAGGCGMADVEAIGRLISLGTSFGDLDSGRFTASFADQLRSRSWDSGRTRFVRA
jgi:ribonucleoside-diphosphate reductase alpha chain